MWMLLQGAYANEWIERKAASGQAAVEKRGLSNATKASAGHAAGAASTLKAIEQKNVLAPNLFKMPRFKHVSCRVQLPGGHEAVFQPRETKV